MNREKYDALVTYIKTFKKVAIAFSGGVDSTFLAYAAKEALGEEAIVLTLDSPYIPRWELEESKSLAKMIGIRHEIILMPSIPEEIYNNPKERCYLCKKNIFNSLLKRAKELGISILMDGSNFDDTKDYRPGMLALKELKIESPLLALEWTKDEIRIASQVVDLPTHNKPAYACLLTRLPYGQEIKKTDLAKIEKAEVFMMSLGFKAVRVRCHSDLARIEVARHMREKLFDVDLLDEISNTLKSYGFTYVAIESGGYSMGSFNKQLKQ